MTASSLRHRLHRQIPPHAEYGGRGGKERTYRRGKGEGWVGAVRGGVASVRERSTLTCGGGVSRRRRPPLSPSVCTRAACVVHSSVRVRQRTTEARCGQERCQIACRGWLIEWALTRGRRSGCPHRPGGAGGAEDNRVPLSRSLSSPLPSASLPPYSPRMTPDAGIASLTRVTRGIHFPPLYLSASSRRLLWSLTVVTAETAKDRLRG